MKKSSFLLAFLFLPFFLSFAQAQFDNLADDASFQYRTHPRVVVEKEHAEAAGLKVLDGKHVKIVTDLELTPAVKALPEAVDDAFPQLCNFFGVEDDPDWVLTVFLMKNNLKFIEANYLPDILPPFQNGFSYNYDCWVYDQPSDYYRQHLILHEMVHSFSTTRIGKAGPNWFAEMLAELLGMHDFSASPIRLGFMPPNKQAVPHCGRIKEIHDAITRGEARTINRILLATNEDFLDNSVYYWCWALGWFLEHNPNTHDELHSLIPILKKTNSHEEFTAAFLKLIEPKRELIEKQWLMYVASLDYDYALKPMLFDTEAGAPLNGKTVQRLKVNTGWQNTKIHVKKGEKIRIRAKGKFELYRSEEETWPCEQNGVTIEYLNGQPLGIVQAVILTDAEKMTPALMNDRQPGTFYTPIAVGTNRTFTAPFDGTILLRLNVEPKKLPKCQGEMAVEIKGNLGTAE